MGEVKRVFHKKMWILIAVAVLGNLCLFLYSELAGRSFTEMFFAAGQYQKLVERYENMSLEQAQERLGTEFGNIRKYAKILKQENSQEETKNTAQNEMQNSRTAENAVQKQTSEELLSEVDEGSREMIAYHQSLTAQQQTQLELQLKQLRSKLEYLNGYEASIDTVMANAENMKRFRIFSKQNTFSYSNILRTAQDFERVQNVELKLDNDKGADAFVHYNLMYYIAAALMVAVIYSLFDERENGMWQIVHNTPNGRTVLALKRLLLLAGGSFAILFLLYGTTFLTAMLLYGGVKDLANPVQTFVDFGKFTYTLSKGAYILRLFFLSWFILAAFSIILWALFMAFRNRNHTLICTAAFVGIEILVYQKIEVQSVYNVFHYINVVSFLKISDLYSTYINWGFQNYVFSVFSVALFFLTVCSLFCGIFAVMRYAAMRPNTKVSLLSRMFTAVHGQYQRVFAKYPVVLKELHKLVITGKALWAVAALIIIAAYFSTTGQMTFTDAQKEYDKMYLEHGGKEYGYIEDYVQERLEAYRQAQEALEEAAAAYEAGEIELKEYTAAVSVLQYQRQVVNTIQEYQSKLSYAEQIRETTGQEIWLVSDRGYEEIFGKYSRQREFILILALVTAIMIIVSESIAMEYRTGMYQIVHSAPNGRAAVMRWKITACVVLTIGLTAAVYGIDIWNLHHIYGMPYLAAPALSLTFLENAWGGLAGHVSISGWLIILLLVRLVVALFTMTAAMLVSRAIGKKGNRALMPAVLAGVILLVWILHQVTQLV